MRFAPTLSIASTFPAERPCGSKLFSWGGHDRLGQLTGNPARSKRGDLGVVGSRGLGRRVSVADQRGADAGHLVGRNAHADSGVTAQYRPILFARNDIGGHALRQIGNNGPGPASVCEISDTSYRALRYSASSLASGSPAQSSAYCMFWTPTRSDVSARTDDTSPAVAKEGTTNR